MDPDVLVPLAGMLTGIVLGFPIIRAVVGAIERKTRSRSNPEFEFLQDEIKELRARVEETSETRDRVLDLEERLDFAERLLAQRRKDPELPV